MKLLDHPMRVQAGGAVVVAARGSYFAQGIDPRAQDEACNYTG